MDSVGEKPSKELLDSLYRIQIDTVQPYALMMTPMYLYLKANEKFLSVKSPLDFFLAEDLERFKKHDFFYLPQHASQILPFRSAGRQVRSILLKKFEPLSLSEFEVGHFVLKLMAPLWREGLKEKEDLRVDPFLAIAFVNELCDLLPSEKLLAAREQNVELFNHALFRSSWAIFLALHLGYCEIDFINYLRIKIFDQNMTQTELPWSESETDELVGIAVSSLKGNYRKPVKASFFKNRLGRVSQKLENRLERVTGFLNV